MFRVPEQFRIKTGPFGSSPEIGNNGLFEMKKFGVRFAMIASDGGGWEHVSITLNVKRCPDWDEMCLIKNLFWSEDDCVIQFHPPKSEYVNVHPFCLHLWRPVGVILPLPPRGFI
jgi:hypothetical protein